MNDDEGPLTIDGLPVQYYGTGMRLSSGAPRVEGQFSFTPREFGLGVDVSWGCGFSIAVRFLFWYAWVARRPEMLGVIVDVDAAASRIVIADATGVEP